VTANVKADGIVMVVMVIVDRRSLGLMLVHY